MSNCVAIKIAYFLLIIQQFIKYFGLECCSIICNWLTNVLAICLHFFADNVYIMTIDDTHPDWVNHSNVTSITVIKQTQFQADDFLIATKSLVKVSNLQTQIFISSSTILLNWNDVICIALHSLSYLCNIS